MNDHIEDEDINKILIRASNPLDFDDALRKIKQLIAIIRKF